MSTDRKASFLADVEQGFRLYNHRGRFWGWAEFIVLVSIAVAGAITAFAGGFDVNHATPTPWYASSMTLLLCGIVAATGATINQFMKPGERKCFASKVAEVHKSVADGVQWQNLPLDEASGILSLARSDPVEANRRLMNKLLMKPMIE